MTRATNPLSDQRAFVGCAIVALVLAVALSRLPETQDLPALGRIPLLAAVMFAAGLGLPIMGYLGRHGVTPTPPPALTLPQALAMVTAGALLAMPPIAIDLAYPFPTDLNVPLPAALLFYPAIALVAEVAFHLAPFAILAAMLPNQWPVWLRLAPAIAVEPAFQALSLTGPPVQAWLVVANVGLISAVQIWLFTRIGFAAMIGLRLGFYAAWHIVWGAARLAPAG